MRYATALRTTFVSAAIAASGLAQGRTDYTNFESPQVQPIAVHTVDGDGYLFVCNTPDNSVEVYDIAALELDGNAFSDSGEFVTRIPVGLEPVSVLVHTFFDGESATTMLYTANWLGDSVTFVELASNGPGSLTYDVTREVMVAKGDEVHWQDTGQLPHLRMDDEPMHLAVGDFGADERFLVVTKRAASSYSRMDPFTGAFHDTFDITGACVSGGGENVIMVGEFAGLPARLIPLGADVPTGGNLDVLKEPHTVLVRPGQKEIWVLGHQGGSNDGSHGPFAPPFDFDVWTLRFNGSIDCSAPGSPPLDSFQIGGLGTTNFNMDFDSDGDVLYVVGTEAEDPTISNSELLVQHASGFVRTMLYKVDASTRAVLAKRDLNMTGDGVTPVQGDTESLAHATDVAFYGTLESPKVCVTGFNSDRFGLVDVASSTNGLLWTMDYVEIPFVKDDGTEDSDPAALAGPRGVAIRDVAGSEADRAYVLNRLNNTVSIIRLVGAGGAPQHVKTFLMQRDPVPAYVRAGQRFLYNTFFSGNPNVTSGDSRFVACASCHVDGRSDQQQWRLSVAPPQVEVEKRLEISDRLVTPAEYNGFQNQGYPFNHASGNAKGGMITQSLQGLVNFEVGGNLFGDESGQNPFDDLVTNAPYHWRGDKPSFLEFNEAFVNLQGRTAIGTGPNGEPRGVTLAEMKAFETFVNSIHYPPNPVQPRDRVYTGDLGDPVDPDDPNHTGAQAGQKLFHIWPAPDTGNNLFADRSCVQCHNLPDGSNNRVAFSINPIAGGATSDPINEEYLTWFGAELEELPLETAALRGLNQKEGVLELSAIVPPTNVMRSGDMGMGHEGLTGTTRNFFADFFGTSPQEDANMTLINTYLREFDSGVAPIVGKTVRAVFGSPYPGNQLGELETQAREANCGIAVYAVVNGTERNFWYQFGTVGAPKYREVGGTAYTRVALLAQMASAGDRMLFRATPLGSEIRVAAPQGIAPPIPALIPNQVAIVGTTPNTANENIPLFEEHWNPLHTGETNPFLWDGDIQGPTPVEEALSLRATRTFQQALASEGVNPDAHDAPRRLQVTGSGLEQGTQIRLRIPKAGGGHKNLVMRIYPTDAFHDGRRVWETAVELDPMALYTLMLGGPENGGVMCVQSDASGLTPAQLLSTCNLDPANGSYTLHAKGILGGWQSQGQTTIPYPAVP